jgi:hypothetical protein
LHLTGLVRRDLDAAGGDSAIAVRCSALKTVAADEAVPVGVGALCGRIKDHVAVARLEAARAAGDGYRRYGETYGEQSAGD